MLDNLQLTALFDKLGTPRAGRELVIKARANAPVRDIKSRGGNVITRFASRKMNREIGTESRNLEFSAAVTSEYDLATLEYYAQPCELKLELVDDITGEIHRIQHFPDFMVIRDDGLYLEEWKSSAKLARLAERYPWRYRQDAAGRWYAPGIEKVLAEWGIGYRIHTENAIPRQRIENLLHLADYLYPGTPPCPAETLIRIRTALVMEGSIVLSDLLAQPYGFKVDEILKAIADGELVADLDRENLSQPGTSRIYRDAILREFLAAQTAKSKAPGEANYLLPMMTGTVFQFQGQTLTIAIASEKDLVCRDQAGQTLTLTKVWLETAHAEGNITLISSPEVPACDVTRYTEDELRLALNRQRILHGDSSIAIVTDRTQRRWMERQQAALLVGGNEILALVPHTRQRGNRTPRLSQEQIDAMEQIYQSKWRTHEARSFKVCHLTLIALCHDQNITAPSYPTLIAFIRSKTTENDVRIRLGHRMAYQQSEFVDTLHFDSPIHGSRPFQYVHIDHTQADIELISRRTGESLGRPWLTLAVDAWSRRIVGLYLTFDPPSYHSVMMVLRDIVRRHGRLPECIITDNGKDFLSTAFEAFLQVMGVHLRLRPAGRPRFGSVLERVFGRANTEYLHNLAGNTKLTKHVRMLTGKHLPVNFAQWTLESLYHGLSYWAFEYYDQENHPALDQSPRAAFQRGQAESGSRLHRHIQFNREFLIATCPPVDREGMRSIDRQRGVKVNSLYYWNSQFRSPKFSGKRFQVRYDPWDAASVYVRIDHEWMQATCRTFAGMGPLTEAERLALTEEYKHKSSSKLMTEKDIQRLKEFLQVHTPEGALALAFERQSENKSLYNALSFAGINPLPASSSRLDEVNMAADAAAKRSTESTSPLYRGEPNETAAIPYLTFEEF